MISVIICTKDRLVDLKTAVASLGKQTRLPDELIVVDASDQMLIHDYMNSETIPVPFQYLHTAPGLTHQRNIGIEKSRGDLLFFFDDDVEIEAHYVELVEKVFLNDATTRIGAVGGRVSNSKPDGEKSILVWLKRRYFNTLKYVFLQSDFGNGKFRYSGMPTQPHLRETSGYIECLSGCCMAFRRRVFNTARFDGSLGGYGQLEDADISKQVLNAGYKIYYEASAVLVHKVSCQNRLKEKELAEMTVLNYAYLFRKHWPQTLPRKMAWYWTLLGLFVLYLHSSPGRRGALEGIRQVI